MGRGRVGAEKRLAAREPPAIRRDCRVLRHHGRSPSDPTSLPPPLPAGVAWQDVWLHALVDKSAVLTLRRALDDAHLPAASAAAKALAAIVCVGGPNELGVAAGAGGSLEASGSLGAGSNKTGDVTASAADTLSQQRAVEASAAAEWYDALECAPPLASPMTAATAPLWRSGGWGATFAPVGVETASGRIELAADGTVMPDPADEATDRIAAGDGEEGLLPPRPPHNTDVRARPPTRPIRPRRSAWVCSPAAVLLEVGRHPASVAPLWRARRGGEAQRGAATAGAVPAASSTLVDIACEPSETEADMPGSQAAAARLRVVAASGRRTLGGPGRTASRRGSSPPRSGRGARTPNPREGSRRYVCGPRSPPLGGRRRAWTGCILYSSARSKPTGNPPVRSRRRRRRASPRRRSVCSPLWPRPSRRKRWKSSRRGKGGARRRTTARSRATSTRPRP